VSVVPAGHYLVLAALLFAVGVAGVLLRRNVIVVLMSVELMLSAANLTMVAAASALADLNGQVYVFFSLTVAAAEVAVGLALVVAIYRSLGRTEVDDVSVLHG
jgi:NADH-quinone oxidoreductase subunit K